MLRDWIGDKEHRFANNLLSYDAVARMAADELGFPVSSSVVWTVAKGMSSRWYHAMRRAGHSRGGHHGKSLERCPGCGARVKTTHCLTCKIRNTLKRSMSCYQEEKW